MKFIGHAALFKIDSTSMFSWKSDQNMCLLGKSCECEYHCMCSIKIYDFTKIL